MKTPSRALLCSLSAAAVLAGCTSRLAHAYDEEFDRVYELPPGTAKVVVEIGEGPVTIVSGAPGVVRIEALTRRAADTADGLAALRAIDLVPAPAASATGVLHLRGPSVPEGLERRSHRMITQAVVHAPPDLAIEAVTGFGPVSAEGRRAAVRLVTLFGDVRLESCHGDAVVRTGEGAVLVQHHRGGLDVESRRCETMQIFVDEIGATGVRLATVQGGVQAHLPADVACDLDARTLRGRAANSFAVPVLPIPGTEEGHAMAGPVGGGGPPVTIVAQSGNLSVRAQRG